MASMFKGEGGCTYQTMQICRYGSYNKWPLSETDGLNIMSKKRWGR